MLINNLLARYFPVNYAEYMRSHSWRRKAEKIKRRAGYRCQVCNGAGPLEAHHRTYERLGYELPSDLIALCANCHHKFHGK